jgi:hypothetical protein
MTERTTRQYGTVESNTYYEDDGTMVMNGSATVWNDLIFSGANLRPGATPPDFEAFDTNIYQPAFDDGSSEILYGSFELQHDYKEGTDLVFHMHWSQRVTGAGSIRFSVYHSVQNVNGVFPPQTSVGNTIVASGTAKTHQITDIATISGAGLKIGAHVLFSVQREGGNAADTLTGDIWLHSVGVHYQADTLGSRLITTK